MKFFLTIKSWQLFLIVWGVPIFLNVAMFVNVVDNINSVIGLFPVMTILFVFGVFGWIYSIVMQLRLKLPIDVNINFNLFKIAFTFPMIYLGIFATIASTLLDEKYVASNDNQLVTVFAVLFIFHLLSMICIFYCIRTAAKILKSVEMNREAFAGDYIGDFMLIWLQFIGIWFLQPRLNKLIA